MVQLYLVNPKLELLDCNSCPSNDALACSAKARQTAIERYKRVAKLQSGGGQRKATPLEVKYFKTIADYACAEYNYLQCYKEINLIAETHLSKAELSLEDEERGIAMLNEQLEKFKSIEGELVRLKASKEQISKKLQCEQK